ncbi:alkylhydroperoxidase family enzyme [Mycolicibacterium sp. BK556]|uniref:carboxymuconolactone decarboxylase family protein n=1 Tax=unclassified Mycolicibacterium TaxID=2636767 RepID=UPI00160A37C0|nr:MULTISPECIES: carboxymuconolactone decarboxylase family protein [unclassified Mycolicibacterium]MBB3605147.1 alkylhydroperoxidase family enzyme [Mycolicibacterium sp. BK556]MBB3635343.1 alkylhydroperoxidase family enzyme [Mycolicibacterium sp. BK607]MBB3747863.1 alkylhydroperoxidase family enzyme [Mycolicibacterium sp. BK634]
MGQRIPPGGRRELGLVNWGISRLGARAIRAPHMHLFEILGQHKLLFLSFLPYSHVLLNWGKLSKRDKELVILRVGHLRNSAYELQQHRRLARSRGLDSALQDKIFAGPTAQGLTDRQRALITAVDEFVLNRDLSDETFADLSTHLSREQVIEFCALAGHYDAIAAILATLRVPMDFPD